MKAEEWPLLCWLPSPSSWGLMKGMFSRDEAMPSEIAPPRCLGSSRERQGARTISIWCFFLELWNGNLCLETEVVSMGLYDPSWHQCTPGIVFITYQLYFKIKGLWSAIEVWRDSTSERVQKWVWCLRGVQCSECQADPKDPLWAVHEWFLVYPLTVIHLLLVLFLP